MASYIQPQNGKHETWQGFDPKSLDWGGLSYLQTTPAVHIPGYLKHTVYSNIWKSE